MAFENNFLPENWLERWTQDHDPEGRFPFGPPVSAHLSFKHELLLQDFRYCATNGKSLTAVRLFIHDFASVPRFFWRVVGKTEAAIAAVSHDWTFIWQRYDDGTWIEDHKEAADLMSEIMGYVHEPGTAFQRYITRKGVLTPVARCRWEANRKVLLEAGIYPQPRIEVIRELLHK